MKIIYKLVLVAIFSIIAIALLSAFLYFSIQSFDTALEKNHIASQIVSSAFQKRLLLDEYLLYRLERSRQQWLKATGQLEDYLLSQGPIFSGVEDRRLIHDLRRNNAESAEVFRQLYSLPEDNFLGEGAKAVRHSREARLESRLLVQSQNLISDTNRLVAAARGEAAAARRNIILLLAGFIAGLGLTITIVIIMLWRNVSQPIVRLREGTKIVAAGNLDYQVEVRSRDEVGELALSFNAMTRKLKEIDHAKTEFISLASHQLKTPLTSIGWYAEMLLAGKRPKILKKEGEYLEKIARNHRRMVDLVNALLNVSRLDMGTMNMSPERVNIINSVEEVLEELAPGIKSKKMRVVKKYPQRLPVLQVDRHFLHMILQNLLSNALKYTQDGGRITLGIGRSGPEILITVADNGCGIPEAQQPDIFKKMFRADNARTKDADGSGLGLYIAKAMAERLGGRIWFNSKENKGSVFYVALPLNQGR